jgi:hypothetical protein
MNTAGEKDHVWLVRAYCDLIVNVMATYKADNYSFIYFDYNFGKTVLLV